VRTRYIYFAYITVLGRCDWTVVLLIVISQRPSLRIFAGLYSVKDKVLLKITRPDLILPCVSHWYLQVFTEYQERGSEQCQVGNHIKLNRCSTLNYSIYRKVRSAITFILIGKIRYCWMGFQNSSRKMCVRWSTSLSIYIIYSLIDPWSVVNDVHIRVSCFTSQKSLPWTFFMMKRDDLSNRGSSASLFYETNSEPWIKLYLFWKSSHKCWTCSRASRPRNPLTKYHAEETCTYVFLLFSFYLDFINI